MCSSVVGDGVVGAGGGGGTLAQRNNSLTNTAAPYVKWMIVSVVDVHVNSGQHGVTVVMCVIDADVMCKGRSAEGGGGGRVGVKPCMKDASQGLVAELPSSSILVIPM